MKKFYDGKRKNSFLLDCELLMNFIVRNLCSAGWCFFATRFFQGKEKRARKKARQEFILYFLAKQRSNIVGIKRDILNYFLNNFL